VNARLAIEDPADVFSFLIRRGGRLSITQQAGPYLPMQQIVGEKFGLARISHRLSKQSPP